MFNRRRARLHKCIAAIAAFLACLSMVFASAAPQAAEKSTSAVTVEFYRWYVKTIESTRDPMTDFPTVLSGYVSKSLISEVRAAMANEGGLEADYFIQAQDYSDDWSTNVRVIKSKIHGDTATLELELGASADTRQRLAVMLIREHRTWKIRLVRPLQ